MRPILLLALPGLMASGMTLAQTATESRVLRFPDICADTIAFVKGGDIYTVPASGGTAMHLTTHAGQELYPKFSPDCRSIAFSAEYDGTRQVYVMPTAGGEPRQLTWYNDIGRQPVRGGTDYRVLDWTVDGANVLVRANRVATDDRGGRPYLVPVAGGMETPLAVPETGGGMLSPDGKRFVYTPIDREFRSWKRYRGGRAQDVWTFDLTNNSARRLTDNPASDSQPTWVGDTIYFTSDRNHTMNLFAVSPEGGEARQLTWFTDFDVLWPSAGKDAIVFENGGAIWRFDPASAQATRVPIRVSGDSPQRLPTWKEVVGQTESFDLDASGNTLLFAARGELFRVSGNELDVRNLSQTPDARELGVDLSADGRTLAYLSDASGEYEIYLADIAGGKSRQLTRDGDVWRFAPQFSPDGKHLAYADKRQRLRIVDVDSGRTREVDSSRNDDITEYTWSPDGQWLAYTLTSDNGLTRIWLYSLKDGSRTAATEATSSAFNPVFDPKGRRLYFLSNRDFNLQFSAFEQNYLYVDATRIYALSLSAQGPFLYADADADSAGEAKDKPAAATTPSIRMDLAGMIGREQVMNAASGNYRSLQASADAVFYGAGDGGRDDGAFELRMLALDADKDTTLAKGLSDYRLAADGSKVLARAGDKFSRIETKPDQDLAKSALDLSRMKLLIDPPREWRQEFTDGWRILRDWFYDPGMHGGIERWNAIRDRYAPLAAAVVTREDLNYVLHEIAGEANAGHVYVERGPNAASQTRKPGGLLGAEFSRDDSGYFRIERIFAGENWDAANRSPLTEAGVNVKSGEFLLAVDGVDARSVQNVYALLENKAERVVELRVNAKANAQGSRVVRVKTLASEENLRYLNWVAERRAMVDRLSGGRIGYLHLPNTAVEGNRELNQWLAPLAHKDALIIDDRYNGGGFIPDRMIELLSRTPLNYWKRRGLEPQPTPGIAHRGPKAMLINGLSSSGGDALPYYFRHEKLGTLIGTRTWGGLIGISGNPPLIDGGMILAATFRFMSAEDGSWQVENEGVAPDIEVVDRPELIAAGRDPSLEKAVEVLLLQLETDTPKPIVAPPAPTAFR